MPHFTQISVRQFKDKTTPEFDDNFDFVENLEDKVENDDGSYFDEFGFDNGQNSSADEVPMEDFSLNFEEIKVTYSEDAVLDFALTGNEGFIL